MRTGDRQSGVCPCPTPSKVGHAPCLYHSPEMISSCFGGVEPKTRPLTSTYCRGTTRATCARVTPQQQVLVSQSVSQEGRSGCGLRIETPTPLLTPPTPPETETHSHTSQTETHSHSGYAFVCFLQQPPRPPLRMGCPSSTSQWETQRPFCVGGGGGEAWARGGGTWGHKRPDVEGLATVGCPNPTRRWAELAREGGEGVGRHPCGTREIIRACRAQRRWGREELSEGYLSLPASRSLSLPPSPSPPTVDCGRASQEPLCAWEARQLVHLGWM